MRLDYGINNLYNNTFYIIIKQTYIHLTNTKLLQAKVKQQQKRWKGNLSQILLGIINMNKIESSTQKWIEVDRRVWVVANSQMFNKDEDVFLQGKVIKITPDKITVVLRDQLEEGLTYEAKEHVVKYDQCQKLTYEAHDVSDMVDLEELNQPQLLYNLKRRYFRDHIFTYCGPTLVIINPYAFIEELFNEKVLYEYQTYAFMETLEYKNLYPHVYGLSAFCLWQLFENNRNQSIVISGESGAGKTENTKYCLKFLASLGKNMKVLKNQKSFWKVVNAKVGKALMGGNRQGRLAGIEDKILGCNQILQAFGNAKTIRNDNSSRFGKLILLLYGETQVDIKSSVIISYLLEKSRIVSVAEGERNYHMFYYFLKGTTPEEKSRLMLHDSHRKYKYLNQSSVFEIKGVSDEERFRFLKSDFQNYFQPNQVECIMKVLAIVLSIGNLQFKKQLSENNQEMGVITNPEYLKIVAQLMEVDYAKLQHSFRYKTRKMGVTVINSPLKLDQVRALQDSFAKNLYEKNFYFLVMKLNQKIQLEKINFDQNNKSFRKSIGLLDIFGFEVLGTNSLEQFFINFANQKLQQLYVSYIFKEEQNDFLKQGLTDFSQDICFQDNKPVIDLFEEYPLGLFHLINQSSELNRKDEDLPQSIVKNHPKNKFMVVPRSKRGTFLINHSCSPVSYSTQGFTSRNKDEFPTQLREVIVQGNNATLKGIIVGDEAAQDAPKQRSAAKKFLGSKFLNEMNKLTQQLYSSDCHFVRCIKPNSHKAPRMFSSFAVLQSLRYLGVLDSILIRKLGYIYRRPFKQFLKKFYEVDSYIFSFPKFIANKSEDDFKEDCKNFVLKHAADELGDRQILLGHKKILIKESALNHLQVKAKDKRRMRIQCADKIKRMYESAVFRGEVKSWLGCIKTLKRHMLGVVTEVRSKIIKQKCMKIQHYVKRYLLEKRFQRIKEQATKSVTKIGSTWKMYKQRKAYLATRQKIIKMQANVRFFTSMGRFLKEQKCREAALHIFESSWEVIENKKAIMIQKTWKGYVVRRQFKKVMQEIRRKLRLVKYRQYLNKVLSKVKYQKYLKLLNKYKGPIVKMQALARGKFTHRAYNMSRQCAILIQRAFRRHLKKKYYLISLWRQYRKYIFTQEKLKGKEMGRLGVECPEELGHVKHYPQTVGGLVQLYPLEMQDRYGRRQGISPQWGINELIAFNDKNTFQCYIGDYDMIGTHYYQGQWLPRFTDVKQELKRKNEYPVHIALGQQITSIVSNKEKVYTFYADPNVNSNRIEIAGTPQQLTVGMHSAYLLRSDKKVYAWGYNYQNSISQSSNLMAECREIPELSQLEIAQVVARGEERFFIDKNAKAYQYLQDEFELDWSLQPIDFGSRVTVKSIAASYTFALFLTTTGQVYARGSNLKGELGLGRTFGREIIDPIQIPYFAKNSKEMIETISVGMAHAVAKSKLGYVYTWGDNCYQQATSKSVPHLASPEPLQSQEGKMKVLQAVAGARTTYLLLDHIKTVALGTSSSFPFQKGVFLYPIELIKQTSNCKSLAQIKLSTRWTTQLSILYVNAIDVTHVKAGVKKDVPMKYAKMMAKEWVEDRIYPSYHQWTDNILQLSDLRKFKFMTPSPNRKNSSARNKNGSAGCDSDFEELRALFELRKTSAVFRKAAVQKMQQMSQKLNGKPHQSWTESDRELHKFIQQNSKHFR